MYLVICLPRGLPRTEYPSPRYVPARNPKSLGSITAGVFSADCWARATSAVLMNVVAMGFVNVNTITSVAMKRAVASVPNFLMGFSLVSPRLTRRTSSAVGLQRQEASVDS